MERVIYAKYSRERRPEFQIATYILEKENKEKIVSKKALCAAGKAHTEQMAAHYEQLKNLYEGSGLEVCPCTLAADGEVQFAYCEGKNLDQLLTEYIEAKNLDKVQEELEFLWKILTLSKDKPLSNLDMILSNILVGERRVLIDYEWVFETEIPASFLFARSLLLHGKFQTLPLEEQERFYGIGGVKMEELSAYHEMEVQFQKYVTGKDETYVLSKLYPKLETRSFFLKNWDTKGQYYRISLWGKRKDSSQHLEKLFAEQHIAVNNEIELDINIQNSDQYSEFIFMPTDAATIMKLHSVQGECIKKEQMEELQCRSHNARLKQGQDYMFQEPPQMIFENQGYEKLHISYIVYHQNHFLVKEEIEFRAENEQLHEVLRKYTGTLPRRALRKLKRVISGK